MLARNESGGSESCRQKVIRKLDAFLETIPAGIDEGEKLERLSAYFAKVARVTECFADNFELEQFIQRGHGNPETRNIQCLDSMLEGNDEAVMLLQAIRDEMANSRLSRVNGTSILFQQCVEKCKGEEIRLKTAHILMDEVHKHPDITLSRL